MEQTENNRCHIWSTYLNWLAKSQDKQRDPVTLLRYLLRLLLITARQFKQNDLSLRSSALTYAILLSMVPMLAMSTAVVKGLGGGDQLREAAYSYLETLEKVKKPTEHTGVAPQADENLRKADAQMPAANLTDHLRSAVDQLFDYVDRTNFATLGTFGVIGILLSVLMVLGNIETAMNSIWQVAASRPILRKIADYLTLLILLPLSINLAFASSAFLKNPQLALKIDFYIPLDWIQAIILQALPIFFITISFYVMYIFFPNTKVKTLPALIGAAIAACCWVFIQDVYITMQIGVAKYNAIYGSFATVPLFLIWIYLSWLFILIGAQIAYAIQSEKKFNINKQLTSPSVQLSAAFDIMEEVFRAFTNGKQLNLKDLTHTLSSYTPEIITSLTTTLIDSNIITCTEEDERLLPLFPESKYDTSTIVEIILGKEAPETTGGKRSRTAIQAAMHS
jgi:membrane protein